jgi:uncharacterized membrane protein
MKLVCPHCGVKGSIDDKFLGKKLKCPKCNQSFTVAEEEAAQAAPAVDDLFASEASESAASPPPAPPTPPSSESSDSLDSSDSDEQLDEPAICTNCGNSFPQDELIELEGQQICGICKPIVLQKLKEGAVATDSGSLEKGIAGHYSFQIGEVLSEAWEKTNGAKKPILGAVSAMYAISFLIMFIGGELISLLGLDQNGMMLFIISNLIINLLNIVLSVILTAGIMMMGVRWATGQPINFSMLVDGVAKIKPLLIAMILMWIIIAIGFLLLIIPGIYLSIAYGLTIPLIMEKGLGPWEAMEASRKAIHHSWFQIFGLYLVMSLIFMISVIPLGIGLIWTIPMGTIALGIVYRIIFGIEK